MKVLGIVLVIGGILALLFGGIGYDRNRTVIDVGPIKATATEHKSIPIPPIAGGIALVAGLALLILPKRRLT